MDGFIKLCITLLGLFVIFACAYYNTMLSREWFTSKRSFSIVIPCYPPHFKFLDKLIEQINNFNVTDDFTIKEIIIAASETDTIDIKTISKYPIVLSLSSERCNASKNRNRGWEKVRGDWIVFLDADDIYHPDKILVTNKVISENPDVDCFIHGYKRGSIKDEDFLKPVSNPRIILSDEVYSQTFNKNNIHGSNVKFPMKDVLPAQHAAITVRSSSNIRFDEDVSKERREDGIFCREHLKNRKFAMINAVLMMYNDDHVFIEGYILQTFEPWIDKTYTVYCFWTGDNPMSENRKRSVEILKDRTECSVILVTKDNLADYLLPEEPLHEAYQYLTETHKADYLRTYFMNFHGGGYSDIKKTTGSWRKSFDELEASDKWICGYKELENGVAVNSLSDHWKLLIGNGAYICKPGTPLTKKWYGKMMALMDEKLELLRKHPGTHPQDRLEYGKGYPIGWSEMLGKIFHQVCYDYKDKILNTLPVSVFTNYH